MYNKTMHYVNIPALGGIVAVSLGPRKVSNTFFSP